MISVYNKCVLDNCVLILIQRDALVFCVFVFDQHGFLVADTDIQRTIKLIYKNSKSNKHNLNKHLFYIILG